MNGDSHSKIQSRHLARDAYVYVRQSSLRQVLENTESTERQYALQQRAVALGWKADQIIVVDKDLGQSGASSVDREGFQRLVTDVGMGRAGIVMGLEVSRLARNNSDWHRLLEICALADTLILDEDGIYDPAHFNDRLLLGMKGTMSEAELHLLRARLVGGMMNKARRGELRCRLPIGLVYDAADRVVLDPNRQVQGALALFFETFERVGSATATVKEFARQGLSFPRRVTHGVNKGELMWGDMTHHRALWLLHHPRYAGAFCYGRSRQSKSGSQRYRKLPRDEWIALLPDAHPGYITWERYEANVEQLRQNSALQGKERRQSPPREGPALLQGVAICGRCGNRMTVRYNYRQGQQLPSYLCQREGIAHARGACTVMAGAGIDEAVGKLLLEALTPLTLDVALAVQDELQTRYAQADAQRHKLVEHAQYEADLAQRRYLQVEPENRLVADALEAHWNESLRALAEARSHYEQQREAEQLTLDDEQRSRIAALANDFPSLWRDPATSFRDRKRLLRLIVEDVTLHKDAEITAHVRFRGGATRTLHLPRPLNAGEARKYKPELVAEVDQLLDEQTDAQVADTLNTRGRVSSGGAPFTRLLVRNIRLGHGLESRHDRLRGEGYLNAEEVADVLGIAQSTVKYWRQKDWLVGVPYSDRPDYLYLRPDENTPKKSEWKSRHYDKPAPIET